LSDAVVPFIFQLPATSGFGVFSAISVPYPVFSNPTKANPATVEDFGDKDLLHILRVSSSAN